MESTEPTKINAERNNLGISFEKSKKIENYFNKNKYTKLLTIAFQRRFRQEIVNGVIDQECLIISNNLIKN